MACRLPELTTPECHHLTDTTVNGASTYTYQVKAFNAVGESALSNIANVTTPFAPPTGLSAAAQGRARCS